MQAPGIPSVDQLLVLLTVVEEGSFTAAARRLRRATSAISYAIDTLETQLGLPLFDRGTTRKPKLTHVGEAVVSDRPAGEGRDHGVVSLATWRIGDLALKHKLLLSGLGWGGMPEPMVRADIESGRLVRLDFRDWRGGVYQMQVVHKIETPPGPAGRWLIERLVALSSGAGTHIVPEAATPTNIKRHRQAPRRAVRSRTK